MLAILLSLILLQAPPAANAVSGERMEVEAARKEGLWVTEGDTLLDNFALPPDWFARRYGVAPPSVYRQQVQFVDEPRTDVYYLKASSPGDASRLWRGLEADLLANQRLVRKGESLIWIISTSATCQDRVIAYLKPESEAPRPKEDFGWLRSELPRDIPGLSYDHAVFVQQMKHLEERTGGFPVRAMYQASYMTPRQSMRKQLAQADFWIPRDRAKLDELARFFESRRDAGQAVYTGKGVVAVLTARNPVGRDILAERIVKLGYRRISPPDPTPAATPPAGTTPGPARVTP